MKIIYWNTHKHNDLAPLEQIILGKNPDFFFISEFDITLKDGLSEFIFDNEYQILETPGCKRIMSIAKNTYQVELLTQNTHYTMLKTSVYENEMYIIALHLPSQLYASLDSQKNYLRNLRYEIDSTIGKSTDKNIIVIGDFNVNPFESPMINFDGFGASNCKMARKKIKYQNDEITTYINPTWQLYSRFNAPGTINYPRPSSYSFDVLEWHYLDQVVISQKLSELIIEDSIEIIEKINTLSFFNVDCRSVLISDHLPIFYSFRSN